jgi:phosphotransferase system  glucose/maltose/N-acetylglucosamine-specific IIC component
MSFLDDIGLTIFALFPILFPILVALYFPSWSKNQRVIAFIIGEILVVPLLVLFCEWFEPDCGTFTSFMNALKNLNLVLVVMLVGFYFYLRTRKRRE